jgi:hypothetical protein
MKLYPVITIEKDSYHDRCVGVFTKLDIAQSIIEHNDCDIHETNYEYAVIEEKETDTLYPSGKQYWYQWSGDNETGKYVPVDCPEKYKNIAGFGIG